MNDMSKRSARPAPLESIPLVKPSNVVPFLPLVHDAIYENLETGEQVTYLGAKGNSTIVLQRSNGSYIEIRYESFCMEYKDAGIHFHDKSCCTVHGTHTSPHMGCLLR